MLFRHEKGKMMTMEVGRSRGGWCGGEEGVCAMMMREKNGVADPPRRGFFKKNWHVYFYDKPHISHKHTHTHTHRGASLETSLRHESFNVKCGFILNNFSGMLQTEVPIFLRFYPPRLHCDIHYRCLTCVITFLHCRGENWKGSEKKRKATESAYAETFTVLPGKAVSSLITFLSSWSFLFCLSGCLPHETLAPGPKGLSTETFFRHPSRWASWRFFSSFRLLFSHYFPFSKRKKQRTL